MRLSELSGATGVPVATVKFYLREGLLPPGRRRSATQSDYDQSHVTRLRLVRALSEVAGLSLAGTRGVLDALDGLGVPDALGAVQAVLPPTVDDHVDTTAAQDAVAALGWSVGPGSVPLRQLAVALRAVEQAGMPLDDDRLAVYGAAAAAVAAHDVASVPTTSAQDAARHAVVGTVLHEPVLLALRRLAHEDASRRRFC